LAQWDKSKEGTPLALTTQLNSANDLSSAHGDQKDETHATNETQNDVHPTILIKE